MLAQNRFLFNTLLFHALFEDFSPRLEETSGACPRFPNCYDQQGSRLGLQAGGVCCVRVYTRASGDGHGLASAVCSALGSGWAVFPQLFFPKANQFQTQPSGSGRWAEEGRERRLLRAGTGGQAPFSWGHEAGVLEASYRPAAQQRQEHSESWPGPQEGRAGCGLSQMLKQQSGPHGSAGGTSASPRH